jgi:ABC-2 type transport system permease protein
VSQPPTSPQPAPAPRRYSPLWQLVVCRIKEFIREPEALFWVFAFPVLLAMALGLAFREKPPDRIPIAVAEGPTTTLLVRALERSPALLVRAMPSPGAERALRTGKVSLLILPGPPVTFRFDETRPDSRIARLEATDALERSAGRADPLAVHAERVTEKGSRYIDFLIPGLLGLNLMGTGIWSLAFSVTAARNRRVLKRLVATPMRKSEYLLAQILSRLAFLVPEVVLLVGFGWIAFGVAVNGSLIGLTFLCLLSAMTFSGIGLLIASRVTTIEASGLANLVMLPMWLVSGSFFSAERFPESVQPLIRALPLTAVNEALRALMTEGASLWSLGPQILVIVSWGVLSYVVALRIFRWQ